MKFTKKTLKNGLRLITVPMKDNPAVMVLVLVNTGTEFEIKKINGISHFLEHMCFKGTINRPSAKIISMELDGLGAENNAFTDREMTGYYAKGDARHFSRLLDIIADIYLNSTFPEAELEREKGVIKGEIDMYNDLPQNIAYRKMLALLYGDTAGGWSTLGEKETIAEFNRETFLNYRQAHYFANKTVVVVTGGIDEKKVLKEVKEKFSRLARGKISKKGKFEKKQKKPAMLFVSKKTDQTHIAIAVRSASMTDPKDPITSVLAAALGQGMSSRLFLKLREEMGAGYYVKAFNNTLSDRGFLIVQAGVHNNMTAPVIRAILEEMRRFKEEFISPEELKKTKEFLIGHFKLDLETSDQVAEFFGGQEILNKPIDRPQDIVAKVNKVTALDIKKMANKIFTNQNLNLTMVGPNKPKIDQILKF